MPKISRASGASHAAAVRVQEASGQQPASESPRPVESVAAGGVVEDGPAPAVLPEREHPGTGVPMEGVEVPADGTWSPEIEGDGSGEAMPPIDSGGEEESSPGSSSETSPVKPPSSPATSETATPKRAPKTGSRSRRARGGNSTAGSADGPTEANAS